MTKHISLSIIFLFILYTGSCTASTGEAPVRFPVYTAPLPARALNVLFAKNRIASEGNLDFSNPEKLEYRFIESFSIPLNSSLEIEYDFNIPIADTIKDNYRLILDTGDFSWELPMDLSFLGEAGYNIIHYSVPLIDSFSGHFNIRLESEGMTGIIPAPVLKIRSVRIREQWYGFYKSTDSEFNENPINHFFISPFVYHRNDGAFVIDIPQLQALGIQNFSGTNHSVEIEAAASSGQQALLEYANRKIETILDTSSRISKIYIPPGLFQPEGAAIFSGNGIESFTLRFAAVPVFPEPIKAEPALIIEWPKENWRNSSYEIFRWDRFPSILIFDTANYAVQNRLLKRLAFFVEKADFRGRLAHDFEIARLHGWNAHDYRAEDLARFFDTARRENFPLLDEEKYLEKILLNEGIIREDSGRITAGVGAIISISRESQYYLRYRFMAHEGFHGLFFIDEGLQDFSRYRWEQLSIPAKTFITAFFDFRAYDINDEYLMIKELMSYVLQQPVTQAGGYFGRTLPSQIEFTQYRSSLPAKNNATRSWPALTSAFTSEAEAFSGYVNQRWGFSAGRVWSLTIR
jgi:hypothetical protein